MLETRLLETRYKILVLDTCFLPIIALSKKNRAVTQAMSNPCELKVRRHDTRMIELKEYLAVFPGGKSEGKFGETELN